MSNPNSQSGEQAPPLSCRGLRGATTARANSAEAILAATRELLEAMIEANAIQQEEVASIIFTATMDLNATYPAQAVRQLGWTEVASLCTHEMAVPEGIPYCIRVLLHWNTRRRPAELVHVYLHGASRLRPDRSGRSGASNNAYSAAKVTSGGA